MLDVQNCELRWRVNARDSSPPSQSWVASQQCCFTKVTVRSDNDTRFAQELHGP